MSDQDHAFARRADAFMRDILQKLDELDPDDVDSQLSQGVLTMEFANRTKCIMNRQSAAHQIWLAAGASAWHFAYDPASDTWLDTKGRGSLAVVLSQVLSERLGFEVKL